jgi:signal peptide peptidase SppA
MAIKRGHTKTRDKRFRRVIDSVYGTPLCITEAKLAVILDVLDRRSAGQRLSTTELRAMLGDAGGEGRGYQITADGIGILPLYGVISQRMNLLTNISGGTSTQLFCRDFRVLLADPSVKGIVIDCDSPGGGVPGVAEASDMIFAARGIKPIEAVSNSQMDSGCYWIASAAPRVSAAPGAELGSIGVYMVLEDSSEAEAKAGRKRVMIKSGKFKGLRSGVGPLTDEGKARMQEHSDSVYASFTEAVARNRGRSVSEVRGGMGDGFVLMDRDAVAAGLADRVATLDEVVAEMAERTKASPQPAPTSKLTSRISDSPLTGALSVNEELKALLVAKGLVSADATDREATISLRSFAAARGVAVPTSVAEGRAMFEAAAKPADPGPPATAAAASAAGATPSQAAVGAADMARVARETLQAERHRAGSILAKCKTLGIDAEAAQTFADEGLSIEATSAKIIDHLATHGRPVPQDGLGDQRIAGGAAMIEKFAVAASEALTARCMAASKPEWATKAAEGLSEGGRQLMHTRLLDIAGRSLELQGVNTRSLSPARIAELALQSDVPRMLAAAGAGGGEAFYTTGSFANLTLNSARKVLLRGYMEAPVTWRLWARQGQSVVDFKVHSLVKFGEASDLEHTPEGQDSPDDTKVTDDREYFSVETYSKIFGVTRQMILNDDLGALSRMPQMQGVAAARTWNKMVYAALTGNPNMADGNPLFSATYHQGNDIAATTGGGPPSIAQLNKMQAIMRTMHGLNTDAQTLNNQVKYLLVPSALEATSDQLLRSVGDPALQNPAIKNPFYGRVEPIVEALLDANSTTTYYGVADSGMIDTFEVAFLQGEETPFLDSWWDERSDTRKMKVRQTGAVVVVEYRGIVRNNGVN